MPAELGTMNLLRHQDVNRLHRQVGDQPARAAVGRDQLEDEETELTNQEPPVTRRPGSSCCGPSDPGGQPPGAV